jgi:hypothetical protein
MTYVNLWIFSDDCGSGSDGYNLFSSSLVWIPGHPRPIGEPISSVSCCVCTEGGLHSGLPSRRVQKIAEEVRWERRGTPGRV